MSKYYVVCAELGIFGEKVGIFAGDLNRPDDDYGEVTDAAVHAAAEYLLHEKRDFYFSHNETEYIMRVVRDEQVRTNADRIRAMTDEELAELLDTISKCCSQDACGECPMCRDVATCDLHEISSWLKQENKTSL